MKKILATLFFFCFFLAPVVTFGATRQVHAEWQYASIAELAGFRLYHDGSLICETADPAARSIECSADIGDGPTSFTITAYDTAGNESAHSAPFQVPSATNPTNQPPTAVISATTPFVGKAPLLVALDGNSSSDPDGSIVSYSWNFGDGSAEVTGSSLSSVVHTFRTGTYTVTLTVTDNNSATAQTQVTIISNNQLPTAVISANTLEGNAPLLVALDGTGSNDPDGSIASYIWNFGDGSAEVVTYPSGPLPPPHTFRSGTYTVTLTVTDDSGATAQTQATIRVNNVPPTAVLSANVSSGETPLQVNFDANGSNDNADGGTIVSYAWNFGDGEISPAGPVSTAAHTFSNAGTYTVALTVTDDSGGVVQDVTTITVNSPAPPAGTITDNNATPIVTLEARQAEQSGQPARLTRTIFSGENCGPVQVVAAAQNPNPNDTISFTWTETEANITNGSIEDTTLVSTFTFDPSGLAPGVYKVSVLAAYDGSPNEKTEIELLLRVIDEALDLSASTDSDNDGIFDAAEGFGDSDNDGIPDYLDAINDEKILQTKGEQTDRWLLATESGLSLRLGDVAFAAGNNAAGVTENDISFYKDNIINSAVTDESGCEANGIFDFKVVGLTFPGQSAKVVLPQLDAIPSRAVYRKYFANLGWTDFVINDRNRVASAPGEYGLCPPAGDAAYKEGLAEGDFCVQLTIEDGGPNDSDGMINGAISDPGGVGQQSGGGSSGGVSDFLGGSGGGGGCTINNGANDATLPGLVFLAMIYWLRRRKTAGMK